MLKDANGIYDEINEYGEFWCNNQGNANDENVDPNVEG